MASAEKVASIAPVPTNPIRIAIAALIVFIAISSAGVPGAANPVDALDDPIYLRGNPARGTTLATVWSDEADGAVKYGFTQDLGSPFRVSKTRAAGLTAVHRLYDASTGDFTEALAGSARLAAAKNSGYVDQGVRFYAFASGSDDTRPVFSYTKNGLHRLAIIGDDREMTAAGWQLEGEAFRVAAGKAANHRDAPGALAPGDSFYSAPTGATYVSAAGNDADAGTAAAPVRTIGRGLALAPAGGTVVVRGGTYRETLTISKRVTLQAYPREAVWLDGSTDIDGWSADGDNWRKDDWTTRFDHSPTYTQGVPDNTEPGWRFVNDSAYPMAAHPDQVFINGMPLAQVKSRSLLAKDTFYLDEATSRLYLGTNPNGQMIAASTRHKALSIRAEDVTIRGIGIRRYSPSVFHMGAVTVEGPGATLENVTITDSATTGLSVLRENATLRQVTVSGAGMLGIHARFADHIAFERVLATKNNDEHFNAAPNAGGVKVGHTRGVQVVGSEFADNYAYGFWEDMSVYDSVFRLNRFSGNATTGLFLEISAKAIVGDNTFVDNAEFGVEVNNTSDVKIWNNTFVGGGRAINLVQDTRRNVNRDDQAVDPRQPWPNRDMPWTLGPVEVANNVIANPSGVGNCLLCVEDYSRKHTAKQMQVTANGNVYGRATRHQTRWLTVWSRGTIVDPEVFTTLSAFTSATGQEDRGREYVGASITDDDLNLTSAVKSESDAIALPLPADVAAAIRRPVGAKVVGRF
ncbi:MAG: right-handed parallel beta-helix repeat-containing protein [Micropruina sp.]|uniref:right-handed parallel beta-helix repeat-containing protein n=1 Tax=Micropruina sp. TaxID=2737536 RepID=UPI0039E4747D